MILKIFLMILLFPTVSLTHMGNVRHAEILTPNDPIELSNQRMNMELLALHWPKLPFSMVADTATTSTQGTDISLRCITQCMLSSP